MHNCFSPLKFVILIFFFEDNCANGKFFKICFMDRKKLVPLIFKYAGLTFLGLVVYFLLMKLFGLETRVELRYFNFIILLIGLRLFILRMKRENNGQLDYLHSLGYGFVMAALSTLFFSAFMFIYLSYIDTAMMQHIQAHEPFGQYLNPGSAAIVLLLEGDASGAIISFVFAQYIGKETEMKQAD